MTERASSRFFWLPVIFFAAIGIVLHFNHGFYSDGGLAVILLGWIGAVAAAPWAGTRSRTARPGAHIELALWGIVILFICFTLRDDLLAMAGAQPDARRIACLAGSLALCCLGSCMAIARLYATENGYKRNWKFDRIQITLCALITASLMAAQVLTLIDSRNPGIDVYTISTAAVEYLRHGINPYSQLYQDMYHGAYGYAPTYNYWPGALLPEALFHWIFGDIRAAFVCANLVTAAVLSWIVILLGWPKRLAALVPLLWLSFPVELFVLDQAWVDTLLVATAALFILFAIRGNWIRAGIALGFFCATKQYAVFFAILSLLMVGRKPLRKVVASSFIAFSALMLPFALLDLRAFYVNTIGKFLLMPPRSDALSFVGALLHFTPKALPGDLCAAIYVIALVASSALLIKSMRFANRSMGVMRAWSAGLVLTYGATFLFGKEAFCNYYFLLAFFVLIQALFSVEVPEATLC